jgi:predicted nucleic acid-binding protein
VITAVDTNILTALLSKQPRTQDAIESLTLCKMDGSLLLSPIVFAEFHAYPGISEQYLHQFLVETGIAVDFGVGEAVWAEAGRRYAVYGRRRRQNRGGEPRRLLADFFVGAHAFLRSDRLLTFDTSFFKTNFPELILYDIQWT